jgi:hypothetical protein
LDKYESVQWVYALAEAVLFKLDNKAISPKYDSFYRNYSTVFYFLTF